jgi:FkbM family methyltransferase
MGSILDRVRVRGFTVKNVWRVVRNANGARKEALRACVFLFVGRVIPFVGVERDGVRYVVSPRESTGVAYPTFVRGFFGEETVENMVAALTQHAGITTIKGMTVLEIGANIGTETVSFLLRHGVDRVVAIEPDSENVRLLRANLALNGVHDRATIYEVALSDMDGAVLLEHSEDNWSDHRVRVADSTGPELYAESQRTTSTVTARRLDSLVDAGEIDLNHIDIVWIDAQGHEGQILDGGEQLVLSGIPIITEYWPYGLRRAGGLERFHELVSRHYDAIVDLRHPAVTLAADRVTELADRYTAQDNEDPYTDLLLIRG